jgi:hypothetical protein
LPVLAIAHPAARNCSLARAARPVMRESFSTSSAGSRCCAAVVDGVDVVGG